MTQATSQALQSRQGTAEKGDSSDDCQKTRMDGADVMRSSSFQTLGRGEAAATGKARLPTVDNRGIISLLIHLSCQKAAYIYDYISDHLQIDWDLAVIMMH